MNRTCPICQRQLTKSPCLSTPQSTVIDYFCHPSMMDHHYGERLRNGQLCKMKIRLTDQYTDERMFLRIDFDEGHSHVWTKQDDQKNRIVINHTFMPDFSQIEKLKAKIQTYLIFS